MKQYNKEVQRTRITEGLAALCALFLDGVQDAERGRIIGNLDSIEDFAARVPGPDERFLMRAWTSAESFQSAKALLREVDTIDEASGNKECIVVTLAQIRKIAKSHCVNWDKTDYARLRICIRLQLMRNGTYDPVVSGPLAGDRAFAFRSDLIYPIAFSIGDDTYKSIQKREILCDMS